MSDDVKSLSASRVSRRQLLQGAAVSAGGVAILIGSAQQAEALMTQTAAKYQTSPKGDQTCSGCQHFQAPNACNLVEGPIVANGWCIFYTKKG